MLKLAQAAGQEPADQSIYFGIDEARDESASQISEELFPIARYSPIEQIGSGSSATVFLSRDKLLNRRVAVKVLRRRDQQQLIAFQNEARAIARLDHPFLVKLLDFGITDGGAPYMVLDHVPGQSLEEVLKARGPMNWRLCLDIFIQICQALQYSHDHGVFHRDIKPSNIILQEDNGRWNVCIIDFGLAKLTDAMSEENSEQACTLVGTPLYFSPDPGFGRQYDARSEVYSLACVLFEALTGQPPFVGTRALETLAMHAQSEPPALPENDEFQYCAQLDEAIRRALSKNPDDRFQTVAQFGASLQKIELVLRQSEADTQPDQKRSIPRFLMHLLLTACLLLLCALILCASSYLSNGAFSMNQTESQPRRAKLNSEVDMIKRLESAYEKSSRLSNAIHESGNKGAWARSKWKGNTSVFGYHVDDDDFKQLNDCGPITRIVINSNATATGAGFRYIINQPLTSVEIRSRNFDDQGALQLSKIQSLQKVRIFFTEKLTDTGMAYLSRMPNLKVLLLRNMPKLPPHTAQYLVQCKRLQNLDLGYSAPITRADLAVIGRAPQLMHLSLEGTAVDDDKICGLTSSVLPYLDISDTKISNSGLLSLSKMPNLSRLRISYPGGCLTPHGVNQFQARCPWCYLSRDEGITRAELETLLRR